MYLANLFIYIIFQIEIMLFDINQLVYIFYALRSSNNVTCSNLKSIKWKLKKEYKKEFWSSGRGA